MASKENAERKRLRTMFVGLLTVGILSSIS